MKSICVVGWTLNHFETSGSFCSWSEFWSVYSNLSTPEIVNGELTWIIKSPTRSGLDSWVRFHPDHPDRWVELGVAASLGCRVGELV